MNISILDSDLSISSQISLPIRPNNFLIIKNHKLKQTQISRMKSPQNFFFFLKSQFPIKVQSKSNPVLIATK
uniref:Uncharacterized protein n=1 Tax=Rhizophora mucronata TaxID=61149 RepID=A0A2P2PJY6_RHIMU